MQPESNIHIPKSAEKCEGMSPHIPKWALGILRDFQIFRKQFEGSISLD
jgi:hypothetical protein